ncbi:hypothetical protein HAHI6034_05105 [Hathewaya histolytica]|uniref:Uncharacterized protein n=1 Tax=Hathewaya histolytica TaxID=1498 RepID=A0A4U9R5W3_HATHI|nr:hypothetical protein [Hathewaya histolytica]VTQ86844.1 Uncharacterised protein [Hathewaya histolytica]
MNIKIYKQYSGINNDSYYFTFNENDINCVNKYPVEAPFVKENIINAILDNQIIQDEEGYCWGHEFFNNKTQGLKFKKKELIKMLEKCYKLWKDVNIPKFSLEDYMSNIEEKYKSIIELLNSNLLSHDSWSRGLKLHELLNQNKYSDIVLDELKYYIFLKWWDDIDNHHEKFTGDMIKEWIDMANIDMDSITSKLNVDDKGYIKVYRGRHEYNQGWNGLSWTTDIEVARKFANGCGVRRETKYPSILIGRVLLEHILGTFYERNEKEVLCYMVDCQDKVLNLYQ